MKPNTNVFATDIFPQLFGSNEYRKVSRYPSTGLN